MFSTPETSVHVQHKNREISPLEREEGYGGKGLEKNRNIKNTIQYNIAIANDMHPSLNSFLSPVTFSRQKVVSTVFGITIYP